MANEYLRGLLGDDEFASTKQNALNSSLLMAGLQGLMASGPSLMPTSAGQILGQAGLAGVQAYGGAMDQAEQQGIRRMELQDAQAVKDREAEFNQALQGVYGSNGQINYPALQSVITRFPDMASGAVSAIKSGVRPVVASPKPETFTLKPGEMRYVMGPNGKPQLVASSPEKQGTVIDLNTDAYMLFKYGTKDFAALPQDAQADILRFKNAPDDAKAQELSLAREQAAFTQPNITTPQATGRSNFINPPAAPQAETPTAKPMFFGMGAEALSKPLRENEVPIIQSQGVSPQNKEKLLLDQPAQTGAMEYTIDTMRQMRNSAAEVYNHPSMQSAFGFGGQSFSAIPGTGAADVKALIDTLKNQSFVTGLQNMRNSNPTGGGVGNVSNAEGGRFENLFQNLEQAQSPEAAEKAFLALIKEMELAEGRIKNAYKRTYGDVPELTLRPYVKPEKFTRGKKPAERRPLSEIMGQ